MGIHVQIINPRDFLFIKADGVLDKTASISMFSKIVVDHSEGEDLLIDLRNVDKFTNSILDITEVVTFMLENRRTFRYKIAVLYEPGAGTDPNFFEDYAYNRGLNLKIFRNFEQAITWLMKISQQ